MLISSAGTVRLGSMVTRLFVLLIKKYTALAGVNVPIGWASIVSETWPSAGDERTIVCPEVDGPIKIEVLACPVSPTSSATLTPTPYTPPAAGEKFLGLNVNPGCKSRRRPRCRSPTTDRCASRVFRESVTAANNDTSDDEAARSAEESGSQRSVRHRTL